MILGGLFDIEKKLKIIQKLEADTLKEKFWNDKNTSRETVKKITDLKRIIDDFFKLNTLLNEIELLISFVEEEELEFMDDLKNNAKLFLQHLDRYNSIILLNEEFDTNSAIISIHAGAGGTDACDWVEILFRMYSRWCHKNKFIINITNQIQGESAGIKSITFLVQGLNAYGFLKCEQGVHRLVRISPFDSSGKRHTSFASVDIMPEIEQEHHIEINDTDYRVDTFRSSGAGGQHVNTTDSAVRITYIPLNIVVTCQKERSQIKNKEIAMKILYSKLSEIQRQNHQKELNNLQGIQNSIEWGNQIRSYVLQPYTMVKDHRTLVQNRNIKAVLDGEIDLFIYSYLKYKYKEKTN